MMSAIQVTQRAIQSQQNLAGLDTAERHTVALMDLCDLRLGL